MEEEVKELKASLVTESLELSPIEPEGSEAQAR